MPKKVKPPHPAPPVEEKRDVSSASESEYESEQEVETRARRRRVPVARRESEEESSESSSDSLESSGSSGEESGSELDEAPVNDLDGGEAGSAADARIAAKYKQMAPVGQVVLAQQKATADILERVQSVFSQLQDPLRKQVALVSLRTPGDLGINKIKSYCCALQLLKQHNQIAPHDIQALVTYYETKMLSEIYKFTLGPRKLKTEEQKETVTLLDVVSSDQLETVDFKTVSLTELMSVLELNPNWKPATVPYGTPVSKIPVITKYEWAYLAHMLMHPAHETLMTDIYDIWPQNQTTIEGLIQYASDISDDVHSKTRIYGECVGHINKLTSDYQSRYIWGILDMYLSNICSEKISAMSFNKKETVSQYETRMRQFKKEVVSLGWIPDIIVVEDALKKTRELYTQLVKIAERSLSQHVKSVVIDKPIRQVVSSEEGIRSIPEKTAADLIKTVMTKPMEVGRAEDLVFPRPHILKNPTRRELESYLDKCQNPYQSTQRGNVPITANKIQGLLFLDTIDYMYHCLSHVLKLSVHESGAVYTKESIKTQWDDLIVKYMSQGVIGQLIDLLNIEKPEHMLAIKKYTFQEVEMALIPIQPSAPPKKPELFSNGRLRRLMRQEYSASQSHTLKNPAPVTLNEREEELVRGLVVAHLDRKQPDARFVHAYHHMPSSTGKLFYQPTLFMKHAICHLADTHISKSYIVVEHEKYVLARITDGLLVEFDGFDYINLRKINPLRYDMPFRFLGYDDPSSTVSQRYCAERIYALMEKDMPVSVKPAFKTAWIDILSRKTQHLSINQVLSFLYMLVAFYHPAFQFATSSMQDTLLKAYSDGSAVKLMRDHTEECTVHCVMRKLFNLVKKPSSTKYGLETLVEYTHSFIDTLLSRSFPFLNYPKLSFPYLSSLVTLSDIEEERKQTLQEEQPFSESVRHQLSDADILEMFESPKTTPKAEVFDVDFNVEESIDSQAVAAGSDQVQQSESTLGIKKKKECKHSGGCVYTLNLKNGKKEKVCKKCYEKRI
jgi:hypothetical protein